MKKFTSTLIKPTRRQFLTSTAGALALASAPAIIRPAKAADNFKIGLFAALTGPASLFGPTQKACAELAVDQVNAAGGINDKKVELIVVDGGVSPADAAKTGIRLMLNEQVDFVVGSHDSAVRQALVAAFKGKLPYVYTPIYEGNECAPHTYVIADTPPQQLDLALPWLAQHSGMDTVYMIGNDYVWPQVLNKYAKGMIAKLGGKVVGEEYMPLGAPNKFEEVVTRIKAANPKLVFVTLVGGDNVNFNRTFAAFGADKITRLSSLLEENTLLGIGKENANNLYGAMSYYANIETPRNAAFKQAYAAKFGAKAPNLSLLGEDCYAGVKFTAAVANKAGSANTAAVAKAALNLTFEAPGGQWTMRANRHVDKDMHLADATGGSFKVIKSVANMASGQTCT
ncbi:MAG TPA: substrate-binding domain-containing protein [Alphaproteobacteria bacterium]|jgi:ABC-type branched-subunit amino acid transport system substrate-binding protein|nr:substrate-binding domain-containing protein [Alphaproteobacteria bacterium]